MEAKNINSMISGLDHPTLRYLDKLVAKSGLFLVASACHKWGLDESNGLGVKNVRHHQETLVGLERAVFEEFVIAFGGDLYHPHVTERIAVSEGVDVDAIQEILTKSLAWAERVSCES